MITCNLCHFAGEPIREHRPMERLLSCPKCGQLISRVPFYSPSAQIVPIEPEGLEGVPASQLWGWDYE